MSIESDLVVAIGALCGGRCYPDVAPPAAVRPYVTYQQIGGQVAEFMEGGPAIKRNARMQINAWGNTRLEANALMRQIDDTLRSAPFRASPIGDLTSEFDAVTGDRGARQDFSLWWS